MDAGTIKLMTRTLILGTIWGGLSLQVQSQPPYAQAPGPSGGLSPLATLPPTPARLNPLDKITPVTDAILATPPAGDWLTWRRTYDDLGFSPLKQIGRTNVA